MIKNKCPVCKKQLSHDEEYLFCEYCKTYKKKFNFFQKQIYWALDKTWWWRPIFIALFTMMLVKSIKQPLYAGSRMNIISAFDLGIHELGHILFSFFGEFIYVAGGSLFQCIFPVMWLIVLLRKRWYFASAMCWCWLGLNLFDVAAYAADARSRLLPLTAGIGGISEQGSDEAYDKAHDWYQLLSRTHHLNLDTMIGHDLRVAGTICFLIGLTIGTLLILIMIWSQIQRLSANSVM